MSSGPQKRDDKGDRLPRDRARRLILLTVIVVLVVVFGYVLLVGQVGNS